MNIPKGVSGTRIIRAADKGVLAACIGAIVAVYILDAIFFAAWAPGLYYIPVFILIGVVIRTMAVSASVALQWVRGQKNIRIARAAIRTLWVLCLIACLVPAMSFFAGGHKAQTNGAEVATQTEAVSTESKTARIQRRTDEIAQIRIDRDRQVDAARKSMDLVLDDGNSKNDDVSEYELNIKKYEDDAADAIEALNEEIDLIEREREDKQVEAKAAETEVSVFFAIFAVIEEVTGLEADTVAIVTLFFFAILIEAIAAFGLGAYYDIHRIFFKLIQELEMQEVKHEAEKAEAAPQAEPEPDNDVEPEDDRTDAQINGEKGANAREFYKQTRDLHKLRVPPELFSTRTKQEDAA